MHKYKYLLTIMLASLLFCSCSGIATMVAIMPENFSGKNSSNTERNHNSSFSPIDISDLVLFLDAQAIKTLENNDPVDNWHDQSPLGNDAIQANVNLQPTFRTSGVNGLPAIYFNGSSWLECIPHSAITISDYSIFMVIQSTATTSQQLGLCAMTDAAHPYRYFSYLNRYSAGTLIATFDGSSVNNDINDTLNGAYNNGSAHLFTTYTAGNTVYMRGDGGLMTKNYTEPKDASNAINEITIGCITNTHNSIFKGYISEIIVYKKILSPTELSQVETYLLNKWGI